MECNCVLYDQTKCRIRVSSERSLVCEVSRLHTQCEHLILSMTRALETTLSVLVTDNATECRTGSGLRKKNLLIRHKVRKAKTR